MNYDVHVGNNPRRGLRREDLQAAESAYLHGEIKAGREEAKELLQLLWLTRASRPVRHVEGDGWWEMELRDFLSRTRGQSHILLVPYVQYTDGRVSRRATVEISTSLLTVFPVCYLYPKGLTTSSALFLCRRWR